MFWKINSRENWGEFERRVPLFYLRNRKHVPCFYRVIQTRVEVWENEKCCGNTSRRRVFPQLFRVLPNFHGCLYNSIETRSTCFLFLSKWGQNEEQKVDKQEKKNHITQGWQFLLSLISPWKRKGKKKKTKVITLLSRRKVLLSLWYIDYTVNAFFLNF